MEIKLYVVILVWSMFLHGLLGGKISIYRNISNIGCREVQLATISISCFVVCAKVFYCMDVVVNSAIFNDVDYYSLHNVVRFDFRYLPIPRQNISVILCFITNICVGDNVEDTHYNTVENLYDEYWTCCE